MEGASWSNHYQVTQHLDGSCPAAAMVESRAAPVRLPQTKSEVIPQTDHLAVVDGTCGSASPSAVKDCLNVDYGSCGNACCALLIKVINEPASAVSKLNATLASGGPDGGFTLQRTAEHSLGFANLTDFVH